MRLSGRLVCLCVLVWLVVSYAVFSNPPYERVRSAGGGASLLEERFGYATTAARQWLEAIGEEGRSAYRTFQWVDVGNALLAAAAFTVSLLFVSQSLFSSRRRLRLVACLPAAVFLLEVAENSLLAQAATTYPETQDLILRSASSITRLKLGLGSVVFLLTVSAYLALAARAAWRLRQR